MTRWGRGRSENHPETETGFRRLINLVRDSPGLSGISGIPRGRRALVSFAVAPWLSLPHIMARSSPKRRAPCTAPWSGEVPRACKVTRAAQESRTPAGRARGRGARSRPPGAYPRACPAPPYGPKRKSEVDAACVPPPPSGEGDRGRWVWPSRVPSRHEVTKPDLGVAGYRARPPLRTPRHARSSARDRIVQASAGGSARLIASISASDRSSAASA